MRKMLTALLIILALLGISRTPEAQVGEILTVISLASNAIVIGGCAHAALKSPTPNPAITPLPSAETGGG